MSDSDIDIYNLASDIKQAMSGLRAINQRMDEERKLAVADLGAVAYKLDTILGALSSLKPKSVPIHQRIVLDLIDSGHTVQSLALMCGVGPRCVLYWKRGRSINGPNFDRLVDVAKALKVGDDYLLMDIGKVHSLLPPEEVGDAS